MSKMNKVIINTIVFLSFNNLIAMNSGEVEAEIYERFAAGGSQGALLRDLNRAGLAPANQATPQAQEVQPGFFEKVKNVFLARNWDKGNEQIVYSFGLWTALAAAGSYGIYKIAQAVDNYHEQKEQEKVMRAQSEKFLNNYEQLCTQAAIKAGLIEGKSLTPTLYEFYKAQQNSGAFEMLDYVSAQVGHDLSLIIEKFVQDFDSAITTPASNKDERVQIALLNLAGFIEWLVTGKFQFVEMPEVRASTVTEPARSEATQKVKRPAKRAQSRRKHVSP